MHQNTYLKALVFYLLTWITSDQSIASPVIFPVYGNVYPLGYYNVTVMVGNPPKPYFLDIDTGSDFTWLQCDANGPCTHCFEAPNPHYKPDKNLVARNEPICRSFQPPGDDDCLRSREPNKQCDYHVKYADHVSSLGVLVWDNVSLDLANGTSVTPRLAFGCGYDQEFHGGHPPPYVDGILGLGKGGPSILTQLQSMGVTRDVLGHCFSSRGGGGYLFFGDIPMLGIAWTPILPKSDHYNLGLADLQYSGPQSTKNIITSLEKVVFDSGSTYTYFTSQAYGALVSAIKEDLKGKTREVTVNDKSLPMCWTGVEPFQYIDDALSYFKPLVLNFTNGKNVQFELPPESYLIFTGERYVCLGILNGSEVGLGSTNIIGDISMQDKLVIYDNERNQVGWAPANCRTNLKP